MEVQNSEVHNLSYTLMQVILGIALAEQWISALNKGLAVIAFDTSSNWSTKIETKFSTNINQSMAQIQLCYFSVQPL